MAQSTIEDFIFATKERCPSFEQEMKSSAANMNISSEWVSLEVPKARRGISYVSRNVPNVRIMSLASLCKMDRCKFEEIVRPLDAFKLDEDDNDNEAPPTRE